MNALYNLLYHYLPIQSDMDVKKIPSFFYDLPKFFYDRSPKCLQFSHGASPGVKDQMSLCLYIKVRAIFFYSLTLTPILYKQKIGLINTSRCAVTHKLSYESYDIAYES